MSSLFSARRSPTARLHSAHRRYRSTPRHGLTGPLLLAVGIAVAGHHVAAAAHRPAPIAAPATLSARSVVMLRNDPTTALLGEALPTPRLVLVSSRVWTPPAPRTALATSDRASRSGARQVIAKPQRKAQPKAARKARWVRPAGGPITSPYGRRWGRMHEGLDFGAGYGSPIRAAFDGVIISAGYDGGYGKKIQIRHADGIVTTYSHMSAFVLSGGRVHAGDVIGRIGSTGNSTGPHLHFEVLIGGSNVNPRPFLAKHGVYV